MSTMIDDLPSPNCDARERPVDMLVLHYTGMRSAAEAVARLRDPASRVSSHYVVDEDGAVLRLVPEEMRAWHAGVSFWRGRTGLNDGSIGIEIVNPGHDWGYRDFPRAQMAAVRDLCRAILGRHAIPAANVVAHSDIAPDRKQDPGERFDWRMLADAGIGIWPEGAAPAVGGELACLRERVAAGLSAIGYDGDRAAVEEAYMADVLRAFCRHWRPEAVEDVLSDALAARIVTVARALA